MLDCSGSHCNQETDNNCCTHCQTGRGVSQNQLYWDIQLDQDLLETIINIYPEWFKENTLNEMTEETNSPLMPFLQTIEAEAGSPPKVDNQSLRNAMDKNKESLKVKLMLRRPINQLIEQGILPPLRTSPGFHEQRQKLERAKTGDFLKHKIQRRPQRQELIQQHILEDTTVDPSLHEKQRQLKKARLADDLNDRLSHRPGPLELIKGNILHTVEPFEQAVKEGQIHFKKTSEGEVVKHPPPRFVFEEESSSDSASSPLITSAEQSLSSLISFDGSNDVTTTQAVVATTGSPSSLSYIVSSPVTSILTSPSTVHSILIGNGNAVAISAPTPASAVVAVTSANTTPIINGSPFGQTSNQVSVGSPVVSSFKDHSSSAKCRKKAKSKAQPKARTIKFHEYKGPPNAKSMPNANQSSAESSYELLLQQQQLFLQWQLEWQQKYPQIILPAAQKSSVDQTEQGTGAQCAASISQTTTPSAQIAFKNSFQVKSINQNSTNNDSNMSIASPSNSTSSLSQSKFNSAIVGKIISKLEDMKVSDLKAELKKRNLPVSGAKQQLIDRLKPYTESVMANAIANNTIVTVNTFNTSNNNNTNSDNSDSKTNGSPKMAEISIKSECVAELVPMSPTVVMGSPPMANNEVNRDQQMGNYKQIDVKSPENVLMEVDDEMGEDVEHAMDLGNESPNSSNSNSANDEIVLKQQQKIAELQLQLQKSQMQLQLQQSSVLPIESQTVTIPLSNGPQFHIVSAQNTDSLITPLDSSAPKTIQRQILQQHLQHKLQQNMNIRPQVNSETNLATLLSNGTISPSVKASLAAFLQSQQQQQQQQTLATKLISTQNVPPFQQLVLCPTLCATTESVSHAIHSEDSDYAKQRTNSLPNGLGHKLVSQSSQRTSSLPNFNSIITTQTPAEQSNSQEVKPNFVITKSPPNYDEATKHINKNKDKKKSIKSQAVDDVLEILIKNGELPPSAAHDPTTPTTPEKILSLKNQMTPIFPTRETDQNSSDTKQNNNNDNNNNNNNNNKNINNSHNKTCVQNNATLDFDFILDLEGLAEAMDLNVAINEKCLKQEKGNNNNNSYANQTHCNSSLNKTNSNNELSLSEFMDFQDCTLSVEDNNWLEMASTSAPSNEQNLLNYNDEGVETPNHSNINLNTSNNNDNNNSQSLIASSSLAKSEASKHDPILPNTMFGGNLVDPLGDLFFDDSDFKTSLDLGSLMWDKVDFAT